MALVSLRIGADSPEPSLLENAISTKISYAGSYHYLIFLKPFFIVKHIFAKRCHKMDSGVKLTN